MPEAEGDPQGYRDDQPDDRERKHEANDPVDRKADIEVQRLLALIVYELEFILFISHTISGPRTSPAPVRYIENEARWQNIAHMLAWFAGT